MLGSDIIASYLAVRALSQPTSDPESCACFTGVQSFRIFSIKGASPTAGKGLCALNEDARGWPVVWRGILSPPTWRQKAYELSSVCSSREEKQAQFSRFLNSLLKFCDGQLYRAPPQRVQFTWDWVLKFRNKKTFRLQKNMLIGYFEPRIRYVFSLDLRANPHVWSNREREVGKWTIYWRQKNGTLYLLVRAKYYS